MARKMMILKSSDDVAFEVEEAVVALQSQTIKDMINAHTTTSIVTLSDVTASILDKVIEYCNKHSSANEDLLRQWDADFVKEVDRDTLFDLLNAANNLKIKSLLNLICHTLAQMMKGMNPQEICELTMRMKGFML